MEWIKCNEALPKRSVKVLLSDGRKVVIGQLGVDRGNPDKLYWFVEGEFPAKLDGKYLAWMPLPDPFID